MGQLKSTLYARMEEVSFRAGAVVAGGVLTAVGVAITLAVVLGGHSDAVAGASASRHRGPSAVPTLVPCPPPPPATPPSTTRGSRTATPRPRPGPPAAIGDPGGRDPGVRGPAGGGLVGARPYPHPAAAGSPLPAASGNAARLLALAPPAAVAIWPAMASPPLIAALACLVVLYSRREPTAAPDSRPLARP